MNPAPSMPPDCTKGETMTIKLDEAAARAMAAQVGVTLDAEAASNAALSMSGLLAAADGHARALKFEAEPGSYRAAQARSAGR